MIYTIGEKSLTFLAHNKTYSCSYEDFRFDEIKEKLLDGKEEEDILEVYYRNFIKDAKSFLKGSKEWDLTL